MESPLQTFLSKSHWEPDDTELNLNTVVHSPHVLGERSCFISQVENHANVYPLHPCKLYTYHTAGIFISTVFTSPKLHNYNTHPTEEGIWNWCPSVMAIWNCAGAVRTQPWSTLKALQQKKGKLGIGISRYNTLTKGIDRIYMDLCYIYIYILYTIYTVSYIYTHITQYIYLYLLYLPIFLHRSSDDWWS